MRRFPFFLQLAGLVTFCLIQSSLAQDGNTGNEKIKIDFKDEPVDIANEIKRVITPGTEVFEVARKIKYVLWEGEQQHPLKHTSQSYYYDGAFHGSGHIPVIVGRAKLMSRAWKEFEIMAIFVFDDQKILQDVFVRRRQTSF